MAISASSVVVEDWNGGYKLQLKITSDVNISDWTLNFKFPYAIAAAYGVNVTKNADGSYSLKGQQDWVNLAAGQTIEPIMVVNDGGQPALGLDFAIQQQQKAKSRTIYVDRDFKKDLVSAIATAQDGDVVLLGGRTYCTTGITIDRRIQLKGQKNTVIDGGGTLNAIISLYQGASGSTLKNLKLTNANNGIHSYKATNLTIQNLEIYNIGKNDLKEDGNQTGISLGHADGLKLNNIKIYDVDRKGIGVGDTNGAQIVNVNIQSVNLAAHHAQSHDTAGIKFFNTNNILLKDSYFEKINAFHIWNDTTNKTTLDGNKVVNVGSVFLAPSFDPNVNIAGIYNEKSSNTIIRNNTGTTVGNFVDFNATEFSTETMTFETNNNFSKVEIKTKDYWVNKEAEIAIAVTENPDEANFSLFAEQYRESLQK